ncbi:Rab-GAP TBC domain-containing protein [Meloidogyne graminicola]|uniref:TBC1 domain family member 15 n=1 Tax=Meloidogyne graminicola TaxID=189291 RepID=A0A8S9ZVU3_9BILA|nr:Rab-GAP TBC domain-containing protein [Meloidogyne graminicola]
MANSSTINCAQNGINKQRKQQDYEANVFLLSDVYAEIVDQQTGANSFMCGVLSIVEKSWGVFLEWKPCCGPSLFDVAQDKDDDTSEWVIEEATEALTDNKLKNSSNRNSPLNGSNPSKEREEALKQQQKYCFSADLNSLRSFQHGNLKKVPIWIRFICKDGTDSNTYHLRGGGYESLVDCLQRYVFLTRSSRAENLVIITDSRTDALEKSVGMLNLDKKDIVSRFLANPYATSMTLASKVSSALAPLLDLDSINSISESQLRAFNQQQQQHIVEDEGDKLRSHNEAGFEHVFQLDLPTRPRILQRDSPVDFSIWEKFRAPDGHIEDAHGLICLIFRGGIVPEMRSTIWKYILGYYKWEWSDSKNAENRTKLEEEYYRMKLQWVTITDDQASRFSSYRDKKALVEKDVARTDRSHPFFNQSKPKHLELLHDLLMTYCMYDFDLGYVQGMSDFLSVLCVVLRKESDIFWCFVGLMEHVHKNFELDQVHIKTQLSQLKSLVEIVNPRLAVYLESQDSDHMYFCFRWILVLFKRELSFEDCQSLWEIFWTGIPCRAFMLLFCVAILDTQTDIIIENRFGLTEILKHINNLSMKIDVQKTLCTAEAIYHQLAAVQDKLPRHICEILSFNHSESICNGGD